MANNGKQVTLAACGSLLLHVVLLLLWATTVGWFARAKPEPPPPPIRLEVVKAEETPPPPPPPPPPPLPIPYLDTVSRLMAEHPPQNAKFQSGQDTEAASELPTTGDKPLPTLAGKKSPVFAFNTSVYTPGEAPTVAAPPPTEPSVPQPTATPAATPPTQRPAPTHTPVPDDEFGLATPTPTPDDTEPGVDPAAFRSPDSTMPLRPSVASRSANQSNAVGFQPDQNMASVNGSITKRGEASVDAVGTPIGRYMTRVKNVVAPKWIDYLYARSDVVGLGMVRIRFVIDRGGKVLMPRVLSNSANEALADISIQAIMDAPIPPIPPEVLVMLPKGELPMDLSFIPQ